MLRLSSPIADLEGHYDVVIVGSGYGGAVAASRLTRAWTCKQRRLTVCVLERGRELQPGDYPDTLAGVVAESQVDTPAGHFRSRTSLYDFRVNNDVNVLLGCGLGGTSLINANVAAVPEAWVFKDDAWPSALQKDIHGRLRDGLVRAHAMLDSTPYTDQPNFQRLAKLDAIDRVAATLGGPSGEGAYRPPINVGFVEGIRRFQGRAKAIDVEQHACQLCGDCVTGCNYGAKQSLLMNYLPDARANGARFFTEVAVRRLERWDGRWRLYYELLNVGRGRFGPPEITVTADFVILASGSLGSTEILRRSQLEGIGSCFKLSCQVGTGFSGNGDLFAVAYDTAQRMNSIGAGRRRPTPGEPAGPCITGMIRLPDPAAPEMGMVIEEGVIPGALAKVLPLLLGGARLVYGEDYRVPAGSLREEVRRLMKLVRGPSQAATQNTMVLLAVGHDGAQGSMDLEHDRLRITWPGMQQQPNYIQADERLREATRELRGVYLKNPFNPITVHPLGGCRMAECAESGVVDHESRVFAGETGTCTAPGLYVCDGSIIPRSLGTNPLLTITALAERMCVLMAKRHGWTLDYL